MTIYAEDEFAKAYAAAKLSTASKVGQKYDVKLSTWFEDTQLDNLTECLSTNEQAGREVFSGYIKVKASGEIISFITRPSNAFSKCWVKKLVGEKAPIPAGDDFLHVLDWMGLE